MSKGWQYWQIYQSGKPLWFPSLKSVLSVNKKQEKAILVSPVGINTSIVYQGGPLTNTECHHAE